jgi:2-dehydro-3-deoxyphosphooctonate aldolase (KDO 8-P synthase)
MSITVKIGDLAVGRNHPLFLVAGPCVLENFEGAFEIAVFLKTLTKELNIPFIFKASYDKANRTSVHSFRGPGLGDGLRILQRIKAELNVPILSDIHRIAEIESAAQILDIIQVPAFLCRQSDLIREISQTRKPVNIKKGQFLAPWDIGNVVEKITTTGNQQILITERGTMFGYNNLVVDFRSIMIMRDTGYPTMPPIVFNCLGAPGKAPEVKENMLLCWPVLRWQPGWMGSSWKSTKIRTRHCVMVPIH